MLGLVQHIIFCHVCHDGADKRLARSDGKRIMGVENSPNRCKSAATRINDGTEWKSNDNLAAVEHIADTHAKFEHNVWYTWAWMTRKIKQVSSNDSNWEKMSNTN